MLESPRRRLSTWKEIAAHIGRDARTAKRYELSRDLPVHRMPDGGVSTVHAFRDELDAWMAKAEARGLGARVPEPLPVEPPPLNDAVDLPKASEPVSTVTPVTRRRLGRAAWAAGAPAALLMLLALAVSFRPLAGVLAKPSQGRDPVSSNLDLEGMYSLDARTPASLARAVDAFNRALARDPNDAQAYVGLATCYNLMPGFGGLSAMQAYPKAKAAAERAVLLAPRSAAAHRTLAFVHFWWSGDVAAAWREFRVALALDPASAETHHWYANALGEVGDARALDEIDAAERASPGATSILADKGWILQELRRPAEAAKVLEQVIAVRPDYVLARDYMAMARDLQGDYPAMLDEKRRAAELRKNGDDLSVVSAGQRGFKIGGYRAMTRAMTARAETLFAQGRFSAFDLAIYELRLGRNDAALAYLATARARREPAVIGVAENWRFTPLLADERFRRQFPKAPGA